MIPDSIKSFRPKNTEIRAKGGHYYVYKVKGVYDKTTKKSKTQYLGCIGQIYEGIGFVPNTKTPEVAISETKEYGATWFLFSISKEIMKSLTDSFGTDGLRIHTMALLRLIDNNLRLKTMDIAYEKSYISRLIPSVALSKNAASDFLEKLSLMRPQMVEFYNSLCPTKCEKIIFDGSSFESQSENPYVVKGYNPHNKGCEQIRVMFGFNRDSHMPVYCKPFPGNITDKTAFLSVLTELKMGGNIIILDKGFFSSPIFDALTEAEADFIIPLSENDTEAKRYNANTLLTGGGLWFFYRKRRITYEKVAYSKRKGVTMFVFFDEDLRRVRMSSYFYKERLDSNSLTDEQDKKVHEDTKFFGMTFLIASKDMAPKDAYLDYKTKWEIEEMIDTNKNTLSLGTTYETKANTFEGWTMINFVASLLFFKADSLIKEKLNGDYTVKDILLMGEAITKATNGNGEWITLNTTKKLRDTFNKLGVSLA